MFRDAFKRHRCIIPASGYYEWEKRHDGRQPFSSGPRTAGAQFCRLVGPLEEL
jgi:putative SOS response-associated peptidase YedK